MLLTPSRSLYFVAIYFGLIPSFSRAQAAAAAAPNPALSPPSLYVMGAIDIIRVSESGKVSKLPTIIPQGSGERAIGQSILMGSKGVLFVSYAFTGTALDDVIANFFPDGRLSTYSPGISCSDMAMNRQKDIFGYDDENSIYKIDSSGAASLFVGGLSMEGHRIAFDGSGDLFVSNYGDGSISKITISKTTGLPGPVVEFTRLSPRHSSFRDDLHTWLSFLPKEIRNCPSCLVFGPDGNLYVAAEVQQEGVKWSVANLHAKIFKITPAGNVSTLADGFKVIGQMVFDADGNLLVPDGIDNMVYAVTKNGLVVPFVSGPILTSGLALSPGFKADLDLISRKSRPAIIDSFQIPGIYAGIVLLVLITVVYLFWSRIRAGRPTDRG